MRFNGVAGLVGSHGPSGQPKATELTCTTCDSLFISTGKGIWLTSKCSPNDPFYHYGR